MNGNDLQPRTTAAIQSGAGPDLIMAFNNYTYIYANSVVDLTDLAEDLGKREGGLYKYCRVYLQRRQDVHEHAVGGDRRHDRLSQVVVRRGRRHHVPQELGRATATLGKKLKAKGHPVGQTLGHTFGDAPTFTYPYLWSWGGKEVEADGKTVVINSKETLESVKFMQGFWKDAMDEGGLAWDDTNNNRAFLSQTISATLNGASIYIETCASPSSTRPKRARR